MGERDILIEPLKVAICEDTKSDKEALLSLFSKINIPVNYSLFSSGEELLENFKPDIYDLLLTDIYMEGITGIEAVKKVREIDEDIPIAFITTSTEFALESYRLSALKYIEKPFKKKDIESILKLALMHRDSAPALIIQKNGHAERIPFSQIIFLEQQTHQLIIYLRNQSEIQIYEKLSSLLPQLNAQNFFSPHKSYAVNLAFIRLIDTDLKCFVTHNGKNIPIRRESMGKAKKAFEDFLFNQTRGNIDD